MRTEKIELCPVLCREVSMFPVEAYGDHKRRFDLNKSGELVIGVDLFEKVLIDIQSFVGFLCQKIGDLNRLLSAGFEDVWNRRVLMPCPFERRA